MTNLIYADNAATTKLDINAFEAMRPYLLDLYANASQPYSFSRSAKIALKQARDTIAACINASPEEIYFTSGGTESDNWAIKGIMIYYNDQHTLITSQIEHHAILHSAAAVERMGYPVSYLPVDSTGIILPDTLESYITEQTKLVSVMLSNNEVGTIEPIKELAAIAHKNKALFHTDAVHAVGHLKIDVKALDIDMLSASAHKFNGPKGVGFLYVKKGTQIYPFNDGGAQEYGKRAGTENVAAIVGMAEALKKNCAEISVNSTFLYKLEQHLICNLKAASLDFVRNGATNHVPGIVSLSFKNVSGEMLLHRLDLKGICVSTGSACDSKNTRISHVLEAMKVPREYAEGTIRISLSKANSLEDVDTIAAALISILNLL